jgi:cell division protein FtsA
VPLGGKNVTNDIAIGLRTSVEQAEQLKINYGSALASMVDPEEMITVQGLAGRPSREISRNVLASIIEPRMEEILSLVMREVRKELQGDLLTAGLVLTGGGSLLPGCLELVEQMVEIPVRLGQIMGVEHSPDELNNIRHAVAHGLLVYGFSHEPLTDVRGGGLGRLLKKIENWITRQF